MQLMLMPQFSYHAEHHYKQYCRESTPAFTEICYLLRVSLLSHDCHSQIHLGLGSVIYKLRLPLSEYLCM